MAKIIPLSAPAIGDASAVAVADKSAEQTQEEKKAAIQNMIKGLQPEDRVQQPIFARIAYAGWFENMTMSVIVSNALWIGIDTEWNHESLKGDDGKPPLAPISTVVENFFCVYFTAELIIRFFAFSPKKLCLRDAWFVFDSILVACMIFETWLTPIIAAVAGDSGGGVGPLSALRLLRLLRLARMGRLMKFVPELGKLAKGIVKAAKSVFFILIFLIATVYIFAIIMTGSLSDREIYPLTPECNSETEFDACSDLGRDLFSTMGDSFMSLFTRGVLGDNLAETVDAILAESIVLMWVFFAFLAITFATLLNMLIGVICEVIAEAAEEESANANKVKLQKTIEQAFDEIDLNSDGRVSQEEWHKVRENPHVRDMLVEMGLEEERLDERLEQMESMLFRPEDPSDKDSEAPALGVYELTQKIADMRPDAAASALDLCLLQSAVYKDQSLFTKKLVKMKGMLNKFFQEEEEKKKKDNKGRDTQRSSESPVTALMGSSKLTMN